MTPRTISIPMANLFPSLARLLSVLAVWAVAGLLQAADQPLDTLRLQASAWLKSKAEQTYADTRADVVMGPVDPRLRFPACQQFDFALPAGGHLWGRGSLEARCSIPRAWRLYLTYEIRLSGPALIALQPLAAREPLNPAKAALKHIDYTLSPESYLRSLPAEALTARPLLTGQPLILDLLILPKVVQAGREVQILVVGRGFNLSQQGTALASASAGQWVKVKTPSGRILQGLVKGPGLVEIHP